MERDEWCKVIDHAETQARFRAVQMHLCTITSLPALPVSIKCCDNSRSICAAAAHAGLHTDEIDREWIYDTGAATCCIGWDELTADKKRAPTVLHHKSSLQEMGHMYVHWLWIATSPSLAFAQVFIMKDCPLAISVTDDVNTHGVTFRYDRATVCSVSLPDGTVVYLDDSQRVPLLSGHCKSENAWRPKKQTEKSKTSSKAAFTC